MITSCSTLPGDSLFGKSVDVAFQDQRVSNLIKHTMHHNEEGARRQIALGADINGVGQQGITPLLWALGKRDVQAVSLLLKLDADPNFYSPMPNGTFGLAPPVFMAASGGELEILKLLLQHGGSSNTRYNAESALTHAIQELHFDCAEILLAHGADINWTSHPSNNYSAFHIALRNGHYDRALWVLEHGYTRRMDIAQRAVMQLASGKTRSGQEIYKARVEIIIADYLAKHPDEQLKAKPTK